MPLTEPQVAEINKLFGTYCEARIPPHIRDEMRLRFRIDGNKVTLFESRPLYKRPMEWGDRPIAQFRYKEPRWEWALFWRDRNERWHLYDLKRPAKRLQTLLNEVDRDPTSIFWG